MSNLTQILIVILILVTQCFLSRRDKAYWGAILPIAYILFFVYGKFAGIFKEGGEGDKSLIFLAVLGTVILLGDWISGRTYVEKKRKKEMEKIEVQNL